VVAVSSNPPPQAEKVYLTPAECHQYGLPIGSSWRSKTADSQPEATLLPKARASAPKPSFPAPALPTSKSAPPAATAAAARYLTPQECKQFNVPIGSRFIPKAAPAAEAPKGSAELEPVVRQLVEVRPGLAPPLLAPPPDPSRPWGDRLCAARRCNRSREAAAATPAGRPWGLCGAGCHARGLACRSESSTGATPRLPTSSGAMNRPRCRAFERGRPVPRAGAGDGARTSGDSEWRLGHHGSESHSPSESARHSAPPRLCGGPGPLPNPRPHEYESVLWPDARAAGGAAARTGMHCSSYAALRVATAPESLRLQGTIRAAFARGRAPAAWSPRKPLRRNPLG
jgi:hypothetical protein